jgi:D-sedoheptulose 7-phosphate isomerase
MGQDSEALNVFAEAFAEHLEVVAETKAQLPVLEAIAQAMIATLSAGRKILWCGNGGSAADSQHLAAELVGRFQRDRRGLASIALTTDTSILTAIANDMGFERVFSRQVEAIGAPGDLLVGITTSGNSPNVILALEAARKLKITTVAFTGQGGGKVTQLADHLFAVPSRNTARIQEAHTLAGHAICGWVELNMIQSTDEPARVAVLGQPR